MTLLYQILSTAIICFACLNLGLLFAFPSSTLKLFSSENTTLDRIMTETELSLMGSISSGTPLIATPFCGYLLDKLGRKRTLMLFSIPHLFGWAVLATILRVEAVIFAMGLCGFSGCILLIAFVYINEYCDSSIRGGLGSSPVIFNGVGILVSYLIGGILEYNIMNYTGLTLSLTSFVLLSLLKESPLYLMKKGLEKDVAQSIAFFKGTKPDSVEVITEIENMRRIINADIELKITPEKEKLNPTEHKSKENLPIRTYLRKSQSSRRALLTLIVITTSCIFQGIIVVQIFAGPLFEAAVPNVTTTLLPILFAIITVLAGGVSAYLTDKVGRRILLIIASAATGFLCVILATNIQLNWAPTWLTVILIHIYTFTFVVGPGTVPYVLLGEVFLPEVQVYIKRHLTSLSFVATFAILDNFLIKEVIVITSILIIGYLVISLRFEIKSFATTALLEWSFLCSFSVLYMFVPIFNTYGLVPIFLFFGGCSFFTAIFSFIYLPETKNLPVDVIQQKFLKRIKC